MKDAADGTAGEAVQGEEGIAQQNSPRYSKSGGARGGWRWQMSKAVLSIMRNILPTVNSPPHNIFGLPQELPIADRPDHAQFQRKKRPLLPESSIWEKDRPCGGGAQSV